MNLNSAALIVAITFGSCSANATTTSIAPNADIFSAGQAVIPSDGTAAPQFAITSAVSSVLHIVSATGSIFACCTPVTGPDGGNPFLQLVTTTAAGNGLSGVRIAGAFFLAGVFLSDSAPLEPAPTALDFTDDGLGKSFASLSPELAQVFFIGDGRTDTDAVQDFFVPAGATRLVLGTLDNCGEGVSVPSCYFDNMGGFDVTFAITPVPLPHSLALFAAAGAALVRRIRTS